MKLVPYKPEYLSLVHRWHCDDGHKIGYDKKPTEEDTKVLLDSWINDPNRILLFIEHNDEIIGYVTLSSINKQFEIADLHTNVGDRRYQGRKVCVEVIDGILKYAFNMGLHRVTTYIMEDNPKLIKTAKRYGWTQEGIMKDIIKLNGHRLNYYIFRMLKTEFKPRGVQCQS